MLDPTSSSSARPDAPKFPLQTATGTGAVGRIITDGEVVTRTLDRPRENQTNPWSTPGRIEAEDAANARAARTEARRQLFAIAGDLDRAERDLASARTAGNPNRIADAERTVADRAAKLTEHAQRANQLSSTGRESITPERVFALLAWKQSPAQPQSPSPSQDATNA